jgi:hypothetical protein
LHDAVSAERAGTPAVAVMTDGFVSGAELMATALGVTGYPFAVIEHPIANATDAQLRAKARATISEARRLLGR